MTDVADTLAQVVGRVLSEPVVSLGLRVAILYLELLWLSCAWWVHHDLRRRTRDPIAPWLVAAVALLSTPVGFLPALALYLVVRPRATVAERAADDLEQALLYAEAQRPRCLACDAAVDAAWVRCPACGTTLAADCPRCGRLAGLDWEICAWCASDLPWVDVAAGATGDAAPAATSGPRRVAASITSLRAAAGAAAGRLRRAGEGMVPAVEAVRWAQRPPVGGHAGRPVAAGSGGTRGRPAARIGRQAGGVTSGITRWVPGMTKRPPHSRRALRP